MDGDWPTRGHLREKVRNNILSNPPDWILSHQSRIPFGSYIAQYLKLDVIFKMNYGKVYQTHTYVLLVKGHEGPLKLPPEDHLLGR
jgi:hypothetical protein